MSSLHMLLRCCYGFKQTWFEIHATFLASDLQLHLRRGSSIHFLCCHDAAAEQMPAHHPLSYTNTVFYCYVFMRAVIQNSFTCLKSSATTILTPGHGRHLSDTQNMKNKGQRERFFSRASCSVSLYTSVWRCFELTVTVLRY